MTEDAESIHGAWESLHAGYQRLYLATPDEEQKDWPWTNAANIFVPLTRATVDATAAQFFDAMLSGTPKVIGTGPEDQVSAELLTQFYFEYVFSVLLNLKTFGADWNLDVLIDGTGCIKNFWNREFIHERIERIEQEPIYSTDITEFAGQQIQTRIPIDIRERILEDRVVTQLDQPSVELVDLTRLKVAPGSGPNLEYPICPWYYEDTDWTWDQALARRQQGFDHIDDELEAELREAEVSQRDRVAEKYEELSQKRLRSVKVKVFYMRLTLPGEVTLPDGKTRQQGFDDPNGYPEEAVVWYLADTHKISRVVPLARIRPDGKRPHIDNRYGRLNRQFYGIGIPATLKHINKMMNSSFNQMLDYGTLRNLPWAFFEPATTGLNPGKFSIRPGEFIPTLNAGGVSFPRFQGDNSHWLQVLQQAQTWAERVTSVTDFTVGRTPSAPNSPRTARGTMAIINQANVAFSYRVALMAEAYVELFRRVHALYRKHAPRELAFRYFNRDTGLFQKQTLRRENFAADVDFQFQLNPNRLQEQQTNQTLFQLIVPYLLQQTQMGLAPPGAIRDAAKELLFDSQGKKNFDRIWPAPPVPQLGMGMGMPPQMGLPQMGQAQSPAAEPMPTEAPDLR